MRRERGKSRKGSRDKDSRAKDVQSSVSRTDGAKSPAPGSVSCEETSRLYAAGEMSPTDASRFETHLAECRTCKERAGEWKKLFSLLSSPADDAAHLEPGLDFDRPVMAFVRDLVGKRHRATADVHAQELAGRAAAAVRRSPAISPLAGAALGTSASATARAEELASRAAATARAEGPATRWSASAAATTASASATVRAELLRRRAIWVAVAAIAAVLVIFSDMLSSLAPPSQGVGRPYVIAITWVVDIFHKGFDWLVFTFMNGLKIGEVLIQILGTLRPIWNGLGVAARQLDPQLVVMEVLLLMLSLVLLKGFLGTAPKGRCTNVGIIL